jgi:hypothetical protein
MRKPHREQGREKRKKGDACRGVGSVLSDLFRACCGQNGVIFVRNEVFSSTSVVSTLKASWVKAVQSSDEQRREGDRNGWERRKKKRVQRVGFCVFVPSRMTSQCCCESGSAERTRETLAAVETDKSKTNEAVK